MRSANGFITNINRADFPELRVRTYVHRRSGRVWVRLSVHSITTYVGFALVAWWGVGLRKFKCFRATQHDHTDLLHGYFINVSRAHITHSRTTRIIIIIIMYGRNEHCKAFCAAHKRMGIIQLVLIKLSTHDGHGRVVCSWSFTHACSLTHRHRHSATSPVARFSRTLRTPTHAFHQPTRWAEEQSTGVVEGG